MADEKARWFRTSAFGNLIGLLALLTAFAGLAVSLIDKSPELTVSVSRSTEAPRPAEKGLQVSYAFNGQQIASAWLFTLRIENTGRVTVVGRGDKSTLLSKAIPLRFGGIDRMLAATPQDGETLGLRFEIKDQKVLEISFDQLRPGEAFAVDVIADKGSDTTPVRIAPQERSLINGDIRIVSLANTIDGKTARPDWLPLPLWKPATVMATFLTGFLAFVFLAVVVVAAVERIRYSNWIRAELPNAMNAMKDIQAEESSRGAVSFDLAKSIQLMTRKPWLLDSSVWQKLEGRGIVRVPLTSPPLYETGKQAASLSLAFLVIGSTLAFSAAMLLSVR